MEGESETRMGCSGWRKEKDVYYAGRDEGRKRKGRLRGRDDLPEGFCREAPSPAAEGGRAGKKRREKGRKVCMFYMLNFSYFFCASLQTQKEMIFLCISLCIHKKEKNVYVKLYTSNPVNVMCAYVYIRILKKCSGWFRYTDFRKFCAGLFAYFSLREAVALRAKCICLYEQKRKQNVYVYIHKKKNKMHMFTYTKFEAICIALRIHKKKAAGGRLPAAGTPAAGTPPAGLHMFTCIHFFTTHNQHANSSWQHQRAKNKKMHTLYIH